MNNKKKIIKSTNQLEYLTVMLNPIHFFQMSNKKGTRKFLQTLQPSGGDKENLVGTGRFHEHKYEFILRFIVYQNYCYLCV